MPKYEQQLQQQMQKKVEYQVGAKSNLDYCLKALTVQILQRL